MESLTVPLVAGTVSDAKLMVVNVLSKEWPLSAKKVFVRAKDSYGSHLTYQGIHKALRQLSDQDVLLRGENGYELSREWIGQLKGFSEEVEHSYLNGKSSSLLDMPVNSTMTYEFSGPLVESYVWLVRELEKLALSRFSAPEFFLQQKRSIPIPLIIGKEVSRLKAICQKGRHLVAVEGITPFDSAFSNLWNSYKVQVVQGVETGGTDRAAAFDYVIQLNHSLKTQKQLDRIYSSGGNGFVEMTELYNALVHEPTETVFIVTRNKQLAETTKRQMQQEARPKK